MSETDSGTAECWEAAADDNGDSVEAVSSAMTTTLNVNAPVFIPNVNAPEFVPSFMKDNAGHTQPAAPGKPETCMQVIFGQGTGTGGGATRRGRSQQLLDLGTHVSRNS